MEMKRMLLIIVLSIGNLYAQERGTPSVSFDFTTNAFYVNIAATASATMDTYASSAAIVGLFSSTTFFIYAEYPTQESLVSQINGITGVICIRSQGSYGLGKSTEIVNQTGAAIGGANTSTFTLTNVRGITYIIPAIAKKTQFFQDIVARWTFSAGEINFTAYDTNRSGNKIRQGTIKITDEDAHGNLRRWGIGSFGNQIVLDYVASETNFITDGYHNHTGFNK